MNRAFLRVPRGTRVEHGIAALGYHLPASTWPVTRLVWRDGRVVALGRCGAYTDSPLRIVP